MQTGAAGEAAIVLEEDAAAERLAADPLGAALGEEVERLARVVVRIGPRQPRADVLARLFESFAKGVQVGSLEWPHDDATVAMSGPAAFVFEGEWIA